jgi:hypothetical protein
VNADEEAALFVDAARTGGLVELLHDHDEVFDPGARSGELRQATLVAGLMWRSAVVLVDELFDDLAAVSSSEGAGVAQTSVLAGLPSRFAHRYTPVFVRRLIVAATDLTARLTRGWQPPACVAQELLLRVWLDQVEMTADLLDVDLDSGWRADAEEYLFEDLDHEWLFDASLDGFEDLDQPLAPGAAPMRFEWWFVPFEPARPLPPYICDDRPAGG